MNPGEEGNSRQAPVHHRDTSVRLNPLGGFYFPIVKFACIPLRIQARDSVAMNISSYVHAIYSELGTEAETIS